MPTPQETLTAAWQVVETCDGQFWCIVGIGWEAERTVLIGYKWDTTGVVRLVFDDDTLTTWTWSHVGQKQRGHGQYGPLPQKGRKSVSNRV